MELESMKALPLHGVRKKTKGFEEEQDSTAGGI